MSDTPIKEKKHLSIRLHIFISMIALCLGLMLVLWITGGVFLKQIYGFIKTRDIQHASTDITTNLENDKLPLLLEEISSAYDLCAKVFAFEGDDLTLVAEADFFNDCIICDNLNVSNKELLEDIYEHTKEDGGESSFPSNNESVISTKIVHSADGERAFLVVINTSTSPIPATVRTINSLLGILTVVSIIIALVVSFILAKKISSPIEKMDKDARLLKENDFSVHFEEKGPREVVDLAKTLNKATADMAEVEGIRKELIANISHDLRTPLTMISGYSEVMRDIPGENTPENMQVIIDETARLTSLVNDLLNVSKLQSGAQKLDMKKISITKTLQDTVKRYDTLINHNGYIISFEHEGEAFVLADETRLLQVAYNLINNAINYTGEDKVVIVKQEIKDDIVRISVTDTGEGISEENLPLIWDRYYKVDKVHKRAMVGTGIGLSIVKNILLLHNSRFGVSSEIGKGSTFWFEFKLYQEKDKQ
ncbi:MAG: two-component sensor histidine kinase [Clostridia bacterium]|nr:two-component sensor histidine kinase [Clostridia bacterium]